MLSDLHLIPFLLDHYAGLVVKFPPNCLSERGIEGTRVSKEISYLPGFLMNDFFCFIVGLKCHPQNKSQYNGIDGCQGIVFKTANLLIGFNMV